MHPLVEEAMKKAAVAWITVPGAADASPVWCLWQDDALYVVSGPGEQPAPGLSDAGTALVTGRGDHGGRIVTWPATVGRVEPGSDEWIALMPQLAAKRLNSPDNAEGTAARWAATCVVNRLTPAGDPVEGGQSLSTESGARPPVPTPAARRTAKPFILHKVRKR